MFHVRVRVALPTHTHAHCRCACVCAAINSLAKCRAKPFKNSFSFSHCNEVKGCSRHTLGHTHTCTQIVKCFLIKINNCPCACLVSRVPVSNPSQTYPDSTCRWRCHIAVPVSPRASDRTSTEYTCISFDLHSTSCQSRLLLSNCCRAV